MRFFYHKNAGSGKNENGRGNPGYFNLTLYRDLRLAGNRLPQRGLRRGKACDRDAIGRARDVVEADLVAERHRGGIAAMLAANPDLEIGPRLAAARHADLDEFADAIAIDRDERVDLENSLADIGAKETRGVVAADAVGGLRQIVGPEGEELGGLRDVAGHQARARKLDHGADLIADLLAGLLHHGLRGGVDPRLDQVELGLG